MRERAWEIERENKRGILRECVGRERYRDHVEERGRERWIWKGKKDIERESWRGSGKGEMESMCVCVCV